MTSPERQSGQAAGARVRSLDGWGFDGEGHAPPQAMLEWLAEQVGPPGTSQPRLPADFASSPLVLPPPAPLPDLGAATSTEALDRFTHARGQGLLDLLRRRTRSIPVYPDAVVRPRDRTELRRVLERAGAAGLRLVPRGGGTSVTGALNLPPGGPPTIVIDLTAGFAGLRGLDLESRLATFGAGTAGPEVEAALGAHGFTLGHFPQSWELSTVGGWIAARASGQESLGYGSIDHLVAGLSLDAPAGPLDLAALPASASGPDLRQLVLGAEGRLGVIGEATLRIAPAPVAREVEAWLVADFATGLEAARRLSQEVAPEVGPTLGLLRLSDEAESAVALTIGLGGHAFAARVLAAWLALRRIPKSPFGSRGCLLLVGAAGSTLAVERTQDAVAACLAGLRAVRLGSGPGRRWLRDRFRHPYLRDGLLDHGYASETLETATRWSAVADTATRVRSALAGSLAAEGERVAVLCHVSHPYPDGASLYFTFFFRTAADVEANADRWARAKRAATAAIVDCGATLTHHHGIGAWHAPWLARETGTLGVTALTAAARAMDPAGLLQPWALLDPTDRLTL